MGGNSQCEEVMHWIVIVKQEVLFELEYWMRLIIICALSRSWS